MYAKRIIPCLDVKNGRVVKGVSFVDLRDAGDPVECAAAYDKQGADELVLLDITATHEGRSTMIDIVKRVAETVFIPFTVGGGIKTVDDFKELLRAGADKISVNSAAVRNPDLINEASYKFGAQCVVCAIDAKRDGKGSWEVYLNGGRIPTGINAVKWAIEAEKRGAGDAARLDRLADAFLVVVGLGCINHAVAYAQRIGHAAFAFLGVNLIYAVADARHFDAVVEFNRCHCCSIHCFMISVDAGRRRPFFQSSPG